VAGNAISVDAVAQKLQAVQTLNMACKCSLVRGWCLYIFHL